MSITFQWSINKLEVIPVLDNKSNVVTTAHWTVIGTDANNITETCCGLRSFTLSDNFVPYEQLTEEQVLDWVFSPEEINIKNKDGNVILTYVKYLKNDAEAQVEKQIQNQINKKLVEPKLPWAK